MMCKSMSALQKTEDESTLLGVLRALFSIVMHRGFSNASTVAMNFDGIGLSIALEYSLMLTWTLDVKVLA